MPTVDANGITIHYTVEGAGPPLMMLHGATSSPLEDWAAQRPLFRKAFRIYLPDARGHAGTKWDVRDGFTATCSSTTCCAFADALGLDTFHLVGFSMGAMTSTAFATRYPERLRTAIICGIDIFREPRACVARAADGSRARSCAKSRTGPRSSRRATARSRARVRGRTLLPAIVSDVGRPALPDPRGAAQHPPAGAAGVRRPRRLRAGRPRRRDLSPAARRAAAHRAQLSAPGHGLPARAVQSGRRPTSTDQPRKWPSNAPSASASATSRCRRGTPQSESQPLDGSAEEREAANHSASGRRR